MNCQECQEHLVPYVEGLLDVPLRREVDEHVRGCPGCRAEFDDVAHLSRQLAASAEDLGSVSLDGPVMDRILREQASRLKATTRRRKVVRRGLGAVAAAVILTGIVAFVFLGRGSSLTLADVQGKVNKKSWVHVKYDDGTEDWVSLQDGKSYHKRKFLGRDRIVFLDSSRNIRWHYMEGGGAISEDTPAIYPEGKVPEWKRKTPWEYFAAHYEKGLKQTQKHGRTEKHEDTIEGKRLVRFDDYYQDALGKQILVTQLWADPRTRLPVRVRRRLQLAKKEQQKREWVTGVYDFPDEGPSSIYDLGVPRHLKVVKTQRKHWPPEVEKIIEAAKAAKERFPTNYRAVIWSNDDRNLGINVIHRRGMKFRLENYFNLGPEYPAYHLALPAPVDKVLSWCRKQRPMQIIVFDGEQQFNRRNPYPEDVPAARYEATVRVLRRPAESYFRGRPPTDSLWPFFHRGGPVAIATDAEEAPVGCVALRFGGSGNYRHDYYVNPERDHICVKYVNWIRRHGRWQKRWEDWLFDLRRLPAGQRYATRHLRIQYGDPEKGFGLQKNYYHIDVKVLADDEFPAGIFDGEKLLKGAKVETY